MEHPANENFSILRFGPDGRVSLQNLDLALLAR